MEWLNNWWDGLVLIEKILYCVAVPSTLIMLIDTIIMAVGGDDGGEGINPSDTSGIDFDTDTDFDTDFDIGDDIDIDFDTDIGDDTVPDRGGNPSDLPALKLFTFQGTVAFLAVFGWVSLICYHNDINIIASIIIGFAAGFVIMYGMAKVFQSFKRLTYNGTLNYRNALGTEGTVYIPIPPKGQGSGKITIIIQGSLRECEAVTEDLDTIPTGAGVRVIDVVGDILVVERSL